MKTSIENTEAELVRLKKKIAQLELQLQSEKNLSSENSQRDYLRKNNSQSLAVFLKTAVEQKNILESVLQSVDVGVIVANKQEEMILFNATAQNMIGVGPVSGRKNWVEQYGCFTPDGKDSYPACDFPLSRALDGELVEDVHLYFKNSDIPDGVLVAATARPIRDSNGNTNGGVVLLRDITSSKANEIELALRSIELTEAKQSSEKQKRLLEAILEGIDIAITVSDKDGQFVFFNAAARRILGVGPIKGIENWTPEYGIYTSDQITPYPPEQLPLARALRGETVYDEELYIRNPKAGVQVLLCVTATPLLSAPGDFDGAVCVFRDITEQKRSQRTLEVSEERFRAFMENLPAIAFIKNNKGEYVYGNDAFFSYHDTSAEKLKSNAITDFNLTKSEPAKRIKENDLRVLNGETPLHVGEHLTDPDGTTTWFSVYKFKLSGSSGEPLLGGIAVDETERREHLRQLEADEQLLRNMIELQEKERLLVAHDIHDGFVQDVVGAKMLSEAIRGRFGNQFDTEGSNQFSEINSALGRAISDARRLVSELRPLVIDEEGIVAAIRYLISEKRYAEFMKITFISRGLPEQLDPLLEGNIFRIVQESLNNAERHSDAGAVSIDLGIKGDAIELTIMDDGVGFVPSEVSSERFGLRGMRERARIFGGDLQVKSSSGRGTKITAHFPIQ